MESYKNMGTGKLTIIQLGRIVRLRHTDLKTWLKVRPLFWNPTRIWTLGS